MNESLHTVQLTRRELGLIHHLTRILYAQIDDDVEFGGTSNNQVYNDYYGKDAISGVYLKTRDEINQHYDDWYKDLQRKDPYTRPFCYVKGHENHYSNHGG